ncbi:MAG: hypothetical protein DWQ47_17015 [Acidobacteria bacterium]|nr:MAG: hypothetical protein DWQ32_04415 [Acidobacteriota bacterium]REK02256.1 MAG: hypothetical protein DWQ38_07735 [Acidobacteriota bacterium]REK13941.1 MAG: hypothetical protein DWQ43_10105 [Acidobacteriota bacterium]REK41935.1 MAG: hypothetical protein DWQ47_17015 [Acidobacteriota bacterium]
MPADLQFVFLSAIPREQASYPRWIDALGMITFHEKVEFLHWLIYKCILYNSVERSLWMRFTLLPAS